MLIDLLSPDNSLSFNIKLAELLGRDTSIYLSELMNINNKAVRKNKVYDGYFNIDRNYFTKMTTLTEKEQIAIENNLSKLSIIKKNKDEQIFLDLEILSSLLVSKNESIVKKIDDIIKPTKKTKKQNIVENLKKSLQCDNEELRQAYYGWIDSVTEKGNILSNASIKCVQKAIDDFANHDLDVALDVIFIATVSGYRDVQWAINKYIERNGTPKVKSTNVNKVPKVSKEVF